MSLIEWLRSSSEFPKFYWRSKEGDLERAALGVSSEGPWQFGGMAFFPEDPPKDTLWNTFPRLAFWTPKLQKEQKISDESPQKFSAKLGREISLPTEETWHQLIELSLAEIEKGSFQKVVLARRTTLQMHVDPFELLQRLKMRSKGSALFAVQFSPESAFIGASPERLYRRKGRQIWVDALAGTASLDQEGLLANPKEQSEFAFVKRSIEKSLNFLCEEWHWQGEDRIYKTASVQHLYNCFLGNLRANVDDAELLAVLHPTAALGGTPRNGALDFIAQHEPFERGWYGAPLGFISSEEAEFIVGIRSALVTQDAVHLFAGTGIVAGSEPAKEWEELNHKISLIKGIL